MKQVTKIIIAALIAIAIFVIIILIRFLTSTPNTDYILQEDNQASATSSLRVIEPATSTAAKNPEDQIVWRPEYSSPDNWTTFILPKVATLANPFTFYGTTTAFENNINWRLLDSNGVQISMGYAYVNSPDIGIPGPFIVKTFYDLIPATKTGKLQVYEASAKDGTPLHVAEAEVIFSTKTQKVSVFFNNNKEDPNMLDCSKVYPVERLVVVGDVMEIAIHELLRGPLATESKSGYITSLPANVGQPQISFTKGGIQLDFTEELQYQVGGSCRVGAIRSQIEETVKQASGGQNIAISINGRTEDILQP